MNINYSLLHQAISEEVLSIRALLKLLHSRSSQINVTDLADHLTRSHIAVARDADNNDKIIGMAVLVPIYCVSHVFGQIHNLVVSPEYGAVGVGRELITTLIEKAKQTKLWYVDMQISDLEMERANILSGLGFSDRSRSVFRFKLGNPELRTQ